MQRFKQWARNLVVLALVVRLGWLVLAATVDWLKVQGLIRPLYGKEPRSGLLWGRPGGRDSGGA